MGRPINLRLCYSLKFNITVTKISVQFFSINNRCLLRDCYPFANFIRNEQGVIQPVGRRK
jgi:hypothetical protein